MGRITPVMLIRSVNVDRGGVTKATLKRANMLAEQFGQAVIITTLYQQHYNSIIDELYNRKMLSEKVKVINFFYDIRISNKKKRFSKKPRHYIEEKGYTQFRVSKHEGHSYRYYNSDGVYEKYKRFDENKNIIFIDYRNNCIQRIKREEFSRDGKLIRVRHIEPNSNKARFDQYYDLNERCILSVHVNPKNRENGYTIHFSEKPKAYTSLERLKVKWLKDKLAKISNPVVISEQRTMDELLKQVEIPNLKKIAMIHASHLKEPYNDIQQIGSYYEELFNETNKIDKIVLLTNEQKEDIEKVFGISKKLTIIPHAYEQERAQNGEENQQIDRKRVVMIARYDKVKRIEDAIEAFVYVIKEVKDAKLEIYGSGKLEKSLNKLIHKKGLKENVYLKGYTSNPKAVYQTACCSILTSIREGFGMVITESMAEGTPVVAYDTKYGPNDIIKDGINGYIVENGNKEQLARKITTLIKDQELRESFSVNARDVRDIFSEAKYKENWIKLIKKI